MLPKVLPISATIRTRIGLNANVETIIAASTGIGRIVKAKKVIIKSPNNPKSVNRESPKTIHGLRKDNI